MTKKCPDFFIIGAPKCGTTSLASMLTKTSGAFIPEVKEPHFFGEDIPPGHGEYYRDYSSYMNLYGEAIEKKLLCGDSSVWYYRSRLAASEIFAANPEAKIIVMVREPASLIESLYFHKLYGGDEDRASIIDAVYDLKPCKTKKKWTAWGVDYLQVPCWSTWLPEWKAVFGSNLKVYTLDFLSQDPVCFYQSVCDFLGLEFESDALGYSHSNKNKKDRDLIVQRIFNLFPIRVKRVLLKVFGRYWIDSFRSAVSFFVRKKVNVSGFNEFQRLKIKEKFIKDTEYLEAEFGLKLESWK
ncbi:MAG TPA: hypothetical protein EYG12_11680 [Gammaproteobacteria bacterium]|jgi:hypothetical protein|nr:hypothetical protein [Gammaproteobacteria bacterium]